MFIFDNFVSISVIIVHPYVNDEINNNENVCIHPQIR